MDNSIRFKYQLVQPDGGMATGLGTREEIDKLKKNFQVRVYGEDPDYVEPVSINPDQMANKVAGILKDVIGTINPTSIADTKSVHELNYEKVEPAQIESEIITQEKVVENVKHALTVVTSGSKDLLISTAKNAIEAVIHAASAAMGLAVIAVTTMVTKKVVLALPGAASNVKSIINNAIESTQTQVKLLTANIVDAAQAAQNSKEEKDKETAETEEAVKEVLKTKAEAPKTAKVVESVGSDGEDDGEAQWVEAE